MKKWIVMLLIMVLLCGCGANPNAQQSVATGPAEGEAEQPQLVSLYDPASEAERSSNGALRAYLLGDGKYTGLLNLGSKLLVISEGGEMTLLQGEKGEIVATAATDLSASWGSTDLCVGTQNLAYYAPQKQEVVLLDERLQTTTRIPLPQDIQGNPLIQLKRGEIMYCTEGQIRAMNIQSGISRMVRSHENVTQELLGSYFDDTVVACMVTDGNGNTAVAYLDSQTGQEVDKRSTQTRLLTWGQNYYAQLSQNEGGQLVFGLRNDVMMRLDAPDEKFYPALENGSMVGVTTAEAGLQLNCYNMDSGAKVAAVVLPGHNQLTSLVGDGNCIWILADQALYRWDMSKSSLKEDTVYTTQMYTEEAPDEAGMARCRERADQLESRYGFALELYKDAQENGSRFGAQTEYQTGLIDQALDAVERVLSKLPEGFLGITGDVRVSLVHSLEDGQTSALYWEGGACHIVLAGTDVEEPLMLGIGNAVDTRVLGNSFDYDTWDELNPWWFDYTYDYEENLERNNPENCLEGSNRYFTDVTAMSFPTEDRARLFANALMDENAEMFEASPIQKKLRCICIAIREAYDYQKDTRVFTWEQYLERSIAPSK